MKQGIIISIILVLHSVTTFAQDIHFSQFNNSPIMINPANTGFFEDAHRFMINSRSQWSSVTVPYQTYSFSYDMQPAYRILQNDMLGVGFWMYGDKAGDSEFGTIQASLSLSYIFSLTERDNNYLSLGFMGSWAERSMNYHKLYFDQQFNGEFYDPSLYSGEDKGGKSFNYFDFNLGAHWKYKPQKEQFYNLGLSVNHITRPQQSFINENENRLPVKGIFYGDMSLPLKQQHNIVPGFMAAFQGPAAEIIAGSAYKYILTSREMNYTALQTGVYYRFADAIILTTALEYQRWHLGISYDINVSDLYNASQGRGGFELSLSYKLPRKDMHRREVIPCPIF
ncbi:MAG: PorP/SprF family type IX secretion system membrane protein [Bacteroidales bacterium]